MPSRPGRALHVTVGVLLLLVLGIGAGAAAQLSPSTTRVAAVAPPAPVAEPVVRVAVVRPAAAAKPRAVLPKPAVHAPVRRVAVRRTAPVAAVSRPVPAPAFGGADARRRGATAYASLGRRLPAGWVLRFAVFDGRYEGLTDSGRKLLMIWVRSSDTPGSLRITLAHELGHVLDCTTLTDRDKARYLSLRGRGGSRAAWYPTNGTSDYASPAGDLAEVYALSLAGAGDFRSTFAPAPGSAQLASLRSFFADLEARQA